MENNKGQSIFLSVVGVATLLVAIVGATFAYFSITATGNDQASSITLTTAEVGGVEYRSTSDTINASNLYPGWQTVKTFSIQTVGMDATSSVTYFANFRVTEPELANVTGAGTTFVYDLTGTTSNGGTLISGEGLADVAMPAADGTAIGTTGTLRGTDVHEYTMTIDFVESGAPQDDFQGASYAASIFVDIEPGQGMRTYDSGPTGWKTWTPSP